MKTYVVFNYQANDETTGEPLFWSNETGWGSLAGADRFTEDEKNTLRPPADGVFVEEKLAAVFL